jgi:rubredoxin
MTWIADVCPIHHSIASYEWAFPAWMCFDVLEPHQGDFIPHDRFRCPVCGYEVDVPPEDYVAFVYIDECGNCGTVWRYIGTEPTCPVCIADFESYKSQLPLLHSCIHHAEGCPNSTVFDPHTYPPVNIGYPPGYTTPPSGT